MEQITSFRNEYYFLSNFYESPITYCGIQYQNNEVAYQAQKVLDEVTRRKFSKLSAREAKKLGREVKLREDWEQIKLSVMKEIVREKFSQNEQILSKDLEKLSTIF